MLKRIYSLFSIIFAISSLNAVPATTAYLQVPELEKLVKDSWATEIKKYSMLIDEAVEKELAHDTTHHVFYHAQKCEFRIVQDFIKALYTFIYPAKPVEDFHFLRSWYDFPATIDANSFIDTHEMGIPKDWNDNKPFLSKRMLSVNFSLFGSTKNYGHFGECTFKYFFNNKSIKAPQINDLLGEIFDYFGLNKKYIPELLALNKSIDTLEGSLFQIFVPLHLVDQVSFAAQRLGTPYRNGDLMSHIFHTKKQRYLALTPVLDVYRNNPTTFGMTLDRLQGRLLFSQDVILNPFSGVKIFRYTTIDSAELEIYRNKLKKLTDKLLKEWLKDMAKGKKTIVSPLTSDEVKKLKKHHAAGH